MTKRLELGRTSTGSNCSPRSAFTRVDLPELVTDVALRRNEAAAAEREPMPPGGPGSIVVVQGPRMPAETFRQLQIGMDQEEKQATPSKRTRLLEIGERLRKEREQEEAAQEAVPLPKPDLTTPPSD